MKPYFDPIVVESLVALMKHYSSFGYCYLAMLRVGVGVHPEIGTVFLSHPSASVLLVAVAEGVEGRVLVPYYLVLVVLAPMEAVLVVVAQQPNYFVLLSVSIVALDFALNYS